MSATIDYNRFICKKKKPNTSTLQCCVYIWDRTHAVKDVLFCETRSQRIQPIFKLFLKVRQWRNLYRRARASRCIILILVFVL